MSGLEARYRAALNWYPSTWREQNADIVIGTLMDEADAAGRVRPRLTELANLAFNGARARLGGNGIIGADSRNKTASLAFGVGVAIMLIMFVGDEWAPLASHRAAYAYPASFGPFLSANVIVNFLWMLGFGLAISRLIIWARAVLVVAIGASVLSIALIDATPALYSRPPATALIFLIGLALLSVAGRPRPRALLISAVGSAAVFAIVLVLQYWGNSWPFDGALYSGWVALANGWWAIAFFALATVLVAIGHVSWVAPVSVVAVALALLSLCTGFSHGRDFSGGFLGMVAIVLVVLALAVAALLSRGYRLQLVKIQ